MNQCQPGTVAQSYILLLRMFRKEDGRCGASLGYVKNLGSQKIKWCLGHCAEAVTCSVWEGRRPQRYELTEKCEEIV